MVGVEKAIIELSFDVQLEMIEALLFELQASKVGQQIVKSDVRFVLGYKFVTVAPRVSSFRCLRRSKLPLSNGI